MPVSSIEMAANNSRRLTAAAHASFVPLGIITILLGPLLPTLSARWSLDYAQAGSLFTAQFLGSTFGVAVAGWLIARRGFRFAINAGLIGMALGVAVLPWVSRLLGTAAIVCYGIGIGLCVPGSNLLVAEVNPERRSAALNLLNFSWSVGAVGCPFLVAAADRSHRMPIFLVALACTMLVVAAAISLMTAGAIEPAQKATAGGSLQWLSGLNRRMLLLLASLFFLYVGIEISFGGWIASYAKSLSSIPLATAVMTPSFFYTALLLGRWLAPLVLRRVDDIELARWGLLLACVGMAAMILSRGLPGVVGSTILAGAGLSAVYPITISLIGREFGDAATGVGSIMFTVANIGGASLPWTVGFLSRYFADLRAGLAAPLAAGALMYGLYITHWKKESVRAEPTS